MKDQTDRPPPPREWEELRNWMVCHRLCVSCPCGVKKQEGPKGAPIQLLPRANVQSMISRTSLARRTPEVTSAKPLSSF